MTILKNASPYLAALLLGFFVVAASGCESSPDGAFGHKKKDHWSGKPARK